MELQDIVFTDAHKDVREKARKIAIDLLLPNAAKHDKNGSYNEAAMQESAKQGLLGTWIPKEYGGTGIGILGLALVVEEFSRCDPSFGVAFAVNALGSIPIIVGGTEEQKRQYLPKVASGKYACWLSLLGLFAE